jgi:hypothetical protein
MNNFFRPLLTLDQALTFKEKTKDDLICDFIAYPYSFSTSSLFILQSYLGKCSQEGCSLNNLSLQFNYMPYSLYTIF